MSGLGFRLSGVGAALPEKVLTNVDLEAWMDTTDAWIRERTGIAQRHIGSTTTELAALASQRAMDAAGVGPDDIDLLLLATTSPEHICPGTAPAVARELGLDCGALDIQAACSGWVYGLTIANGFLLQGMKRILVVGAEALDKITDYHDRGTGILFGNGGGAAVVEADPSGVGELLGWDLGADGNYVHILYAEHGDVLKMDGKEVFRQAVKAIQRTVTNTMEMAGIGLEEVALIVPHQANIRIVESAWKKLGLSMDDTAMILEDTGNTSGATIPMALHDALVKDRIRNGDLVLFVGFGAGMTWGSTLVRWNGS
ncbi:MAG: beta-ketoacyl-ACP synthase III [Acidimicrobiales bacterium]